MDAAISRIELELMLPHEKAVLAVIAYIGFVVIGALALSFATRPSPAATAQKPDNIEDSVAAPTHPETVAAATTNEVDDELTRLRSYARTLRSQRANMREEARASNTKLSPEQRERDDRLYELLTKVKDRIAHLKKPKGPTRQPDNNGQP